MGEADKPAVLILYGDDEFAIKEFILAMKAKMGDPATAEMNQNEFDGRSTNLDALVPASMAMPFLAERRMVILTQPLALAGARGGEREAFIKFLEAIPVTTALVLVIEDEMRRDGWSLLSDKHWLMQWANKEDGRVFRRAFAKLKGRALAERLVKDNQAHISLDAAMRLVDYVNDDPRLAQMEIEKLLAYANYQRTIQVADVEEVTTNQHLENIFEYIDALGTREARQAAGILGRLLEQQESQAVFALVVRQFRLLIQAKDILQRGRNQAQILSQVPEVKYPYVAQKLAAQSRFFSLPDLEAIYRRLVESDEDVKTGRIDIDTALYTLTAALTQKN